MSNLNVLRIGGVAICFAFIVAVGARVALAQADPHVGTWVLSLEKSKYAPGTAPKSQRSVYSAAGKGFKVATATTWPTGPVNTEFTAEADGKDYPVKGNPDWDTTAIKRVDSHTIEFTRKRGGKVVQTARSTVAKDGKSRTVTVTGVNAQGQKLNSNSVYIKQ